MLSYISSAKSVYFTLDVLLYSHGITQDRWVGVLILLGIARRNGLSYLLADGAWRSKDAADWWILDSSQVRSLLPVTSLIHPSFFKGARGHCVTGGGCYAAANKDGFANLHASVYACTQVYVRARVYRYPYERFHAR